MEDGDHDELLQGTDDESVSDTEDHCIPSSRKNSDDSHHRHTITYFHHTKLEFLTTKITLIFSSTVMLILLPLYLDSINVKGNAYSLILMNTLISTLLFVITMVIAKFFCEKYRNIGITSFPVRFFKLLQLALVYFLCAFMIIYALDRKRVVCHLQDPIKGIVLVFSLLYYFFFCRKLMGLQRIFSATTIIVGLFISIDYGLCDEFRCRGYERERIADDAGRWSWHTHVAWTIVYVAGLALFAAYFSLLDLYVLDNGEMECHQVNIPSSFLSTVSRSVSFPSSNNAASSQFITSSSDPSHLTKKHSVVHLAMWLHIFGLVIILALFWTDLTPTLGKGKNFAEFWNYTLNGMMCHFEKPVPPNLGPPPCGNVFLYSWFFMCSYVLFVVMSMKFLILSQSAVYTIATMSTSLPFVGIWWSLFHAAPHTTEIWTVVRKLVMLLAPTRNNNKN
ncbi:unnamed protein product [Acanthoscelides obtectus]|uniref:Uncharacterized protein n=2 Tax=Acanthoscelides obtectus TaxID=200917 RepID=A0A9P0KIH6_ACAOB|nr:unnamed protein product [Acanthoscelides obtectus]CAK1640957.1 hypothetical protein AOBTE_LOCUS12040 [Acanthoscelides obtectus]